ncbi:MAG: cation transporter dimerization domain-containing protein, partial [Terriglobales bacterium]
AQRVGQIARTLPELLDCHDIVLRRSGGHLALSCHCSFPDSLPVGRVHELVTALEAKIKRELPELFRVTIHPEPDSDNRR